VADRAAVRERPRRLPAAGVAKFTAFVALAAIFVDAAIGHGLAWENDPYWTYWITKTFLIATIFGLGTAWFGIGEGRGAIITLAHTLVLTVYYWTLSPIGLPAVPTWLDLEHTWITGLPIHFAVIYAGYLLALWAWRRRQTLSGTASLDPGALAWRALTFGVGIVVVAGTIAAVAIGEFPGFTWFLVRILITVPFLLVWWGLFGTEMLSSVVGGVILALMWATYSQFLGPLGVPDTPLRILNPAPPPISVRWLDYRELWLLSLPIYLLVAIVAMAIASRNEGPLRRSLATAALIPVVLFTTGLTIDPEDRGVTTTFTAGGQVEIADVGSGDGEIRLVATDMGNRISPLPPHDRLSIDATANAEGHSYSVVVTQPMVEDPTGRETTWWGVGFGVDYREESGENVSADLVAYGFGELSVDGSVVAAGLPVEVVASRDDGYGMSVEVGSDVSPIPGDVGPVLHATWPTFSGTEPEGASTAHYIAGSAALVVLLALGLLLNRRVTSAER
jgi:hypothetical protein